jgi:broad specificity phosphatase PhoE
MTIVLIRHGQTAFNFARIVQGADAPLNETGLRQAELVGARLRGMSPAHLLTSDHPRALTTAEVIGRHTSLTIEVSPLLRERDMGDFSNRPYAEFTDFHPLAADVNPPNGETWTDFHARVREAFSLVVERRSTLRGPLLVVTHGLVIRSILERLVAVGEFRQPVLNTSISILAAEPPHEASLVACAQHLETVAPGTEA